ncbi:helix-turn-helix domain-containing protein [Neokomagataea thailandica]|uniref:Cytoskeleton protein RodZ-like C-terminal domain-containing protein n=1 Tax=Neokomagataea tanensis NBRC 106556 TaxID=1223519 RepID=A0ABQ0QKH6_9PROT|nr:MULTISPECIES: helix-turn-helix domain-containing protein [Neokomagataea]GBR47933.1 hypothetical protein AA106556_1627 [Neokomagataea tanensis NBRC 106556]
MPTPSSDRMTPLRSDQPSVGTVLRHRREELEWHIEDVAQWLRIRARVLVALESDDFTSLPGEAYAVGFVRAYAQAMQLDATDLVTRFQRDYHRVSGAKTELVFPQAQGEKGLPLGLLIGVGLVFVAVAYVGWYHFSSHDEPITKQVPSLAALMPNTAHSVMTSPQVASVMPRKAPTVEQQAPVAPSLAQKSPVVAPDQRAALTVFPAMNDKIQANRDKTVTAAEQAAPTAEKLDVSSPPDSVSSESAASEPLMADQGKTDQQVPLEPALRVADGQLAVHAIASVWVQIADHTGHVLVSRVLSQGENWTGDAVNGPYRVSVGNAGGVVFMTHDVVSAPLGRSGAVIRNISVTAEAVQHGAFGRGALPVAELSTPRATAGQGNTMSSSVIVPSSPTPVAIRTSHIVPVVKKSLPKETRHDVTTDELNARQLTGQSPSGDASLGH